MWYFAWLLGLPLAAAFGVLNAMWYELMDDAAKQQPSALPQPGHVQQAEGRRQHA